LLKTYRKPLLIIAIFLCLAGSSLTAYGLLYAQSNVVHVDMQYTAVLTSSIAGSEITLNAAVANNAAAVGAGISVDFYYSLGGGEFTYFATGLTNTAGVAQAKYIVTQNGGYDFRATVVVP